MADPEPHALISCPYNRAHQVEHYRMHIHLQKCRKQHTSLKKSTCPFDATHIINDMEMEYHLTMCPKRHLFDQQVYVTEGDYRPHVEVQPIPVITSNEENWDDDNVTSYKPDPSKNSHIIKKIKGATPSERRKARMEGQRTYRPPTDE